jgi:hypothetical protein
MPLVTPRAVLLSFVGIGALVAGLLVVFMLMGSSAAPRAQAGGPTPTPKPANDGAGVLSGLFDACAAVGGTGPTGPCTYNPSPATTFYACMVRVDENSNLVGGVNPIKSALMCGSTLSLATGAGMPPCGLWHGPGPQGANPVTNTVPGEGACAARAGFSAGPPYTSQAPYKLNGIYCTLVAGCPAPDGSTVPQDGTWQIGCLADFGTVLGPNLVVRSTSTNAVATNPTIGNSNTNNVTFYLAATNAQCTNVQAGAWDASLLGNSSLPLTTTLTRRDPTRKTVPGTCTDMQKLWQNKEGSGTDCPQDPFNPYAPDGASSDMSGSWDITIELIRADVGAAGYYQNCKADIQQTGTNLTGKILCYTDSPAITVNPPAAGSNTCPPAAPKYCGDGLPGAPPPGCSVSPCATIAGQGAGCPALPCDVSQFSLKDIGDAIGKLWGSLSGTPSLLKCEPEGTGNNQDIYKLTFGLFIRTRVDLYTGQTYANCTASPPTPKGLPTGTGKWSWVRQAPGSRTPGSCIPLIIASYAGCRDSDGDGCPDVLELSDNQLQGGLRDPSNPFDWFNPEKVNTPHTQTVADILKVVQQFGKDQGNAAYTIDTDRTAIAGSNSWNLGPPDGKQTVADILAAVKQFGQNCNATV